MEYTCKLCDEKFDNARILANHYRWKHKEKKIYECICGKSFEDSSSYGIHKKYCDGTGTKLDKKKSKVQLCWKCLKCNCEIKSNREKHLKSCNGNGPRRIQKQTLKRGSIESFEKLSSASKKNWENPIYRDKIINSLIGNSKGIASTEEKEIERKKKISETMKKNPKSGGLRKGSGRGKKGWYKGYFCDSSWELAYVIYCLEHEIKIERNHEKFEYVWENETHYYIPDFILEGGSYVEVKGYRTKQVEEKIKQFSKKLEVLDKHKIGVYLNYVEEKYGKDFVRLYGAVC